MEQRKKTCRKLSSKVISTQGCSWFTKLNSLTKQDLVEAQFWLKKAVLKFLFCNARCCIISLPRNLNLRTLKLGICWCGFSCPCQHSSPVWVLFLGFCSLGTQKMSLRHMCRCQQRQVVNCNMFKSEEILNLHICSLLLLLPCKPKLGFHNWHQTKKKICFRKDDCLVVFLWHVWNHPGGWDPAVQMSCASWSKHEPQRRKHGQNGRQWFVASFWGNYCK